MEDLIQVPVEDEDGFEGWQTVARTKRSTKDKKGKKEKEIKTTNRFSALASLRDDSTPPKTRMSRQKEHRNSQQCQTTKHIKARRSNSSRSCLVDKRESRTYLIGDSQVRGQEAHFAKSRRDQRKVKTFPGAKTSKISREVEKIWIKEKDTAVIAQVSGNDLFLKKNKVGATEKIIGEAMTLADEISGKTNRGMIVGILPRVFAGDYATSKAIGINTRLADLCTTKGIKFVDPFDEFFGRRDFYSRDGVHLSGKGKAHFGNFLNNHLFSLLRSSQDVVLSCPRERQQTSNDALPQASEKDKGPSPLPEDSTSERSVPPSMGNPSSLENPTSGQQTDANSLRSSPVPQVREPGVVNPSSDVKGTPGPKEGEVPPPETSGISGNGGS